MPVLLFGLKYYIDTLFIRHDIHVRLSSGVFMLFCNFQKIKIYIYIYIYNLCNQATF